jgi:hypothetical protein
MITRHEIKTGGKSASKKRFVPKSRELVTGNTNGSSVWIRNIEHVNFYNDLRKNSPRIKMPSATQIRALNETLQLLLIAFGDWKIWLALFVLVLIRR